ncbi:MAG: gamma-glutamyl-gamma-aminobutyrate hydrolase family protein [Chloroflexota bacterium]
MKKPIIAITTYGPNERDLANEYYEKFYLTPKPYVDAVVRAGGVPILVPPTPESLAAVRAIADGVIVAGGSDINPERYGGDANHPNLTNIDKDRDASELEIITSLTTGEPVPTLCICRGMQVLNVAMGGSLHEHVPDTIPADIHRSEDGFWAMQPVKVDPKSRLAEIMEADEVVTTSGHHQAVKELGHDLTVTARAADGVIEAIEHTGLPWMIGVQWHPEVTADSDPTQQNLFDELVAEARKNLG